MDEKTEVASSWAQPPFFLYFEIFGQCLVYLQGMNTVSENCFLIIYCTNMSGNWVVWYEV
ncbi:MAG TPA: hypothetical protein DCP36_13160 [Sporomusaceae bacterium]|nr:hypothetical protein [Sporomusaceae bacterium]